MRLNFSKDADFLEAVDRYSKFFAASGHKFSKAKTEMLKMKIFNREEFLFRDDKTVKKRKHNAQRDKQEAKMMSTNNNNNNIYWISTYDPRLPHQRLIISRNYHMLENDRINKIYI